MGGALPRAFAAVNPQDAAAKSGVGLETLERLAGLFARSERPLAIPGGAPLAMNNGLATARAVLTLNALVNNLGREGGVYLSAQAPTETPDLQPASTQEISSLIENEPGCDQVLFIHGANPL
jgi:anaerobic selenocysteine-containing dehydrogenase